ncbi:MAG TPA: hypothetical protein PLN94_12915, partial [Thiolinea sp.]|nr:hypothetical protein [Thiolinea sp.]
HTGGSTGSASGPGPQAGRYPPGSPLCAASGSQADTGTVSTGGSRLSAAGTGYAPASSTGGTRRAGTTP